MSEYRGQHDGEKTNYIAEGIDAVEAEHTLPYKDRIGATFDDLDLHNTLASKADDFDGKTTWSFRKLLAAISLAGFYVGGAIPTLLIGGSLQYIAEDLDAEFASWLITANTLVVAALMPFVGYLTDLVGPRYVILSGSAVLMVGMAVVGSAHSFGQAVAGMAIAGVGTGICEVNALAGISALAPVRLRAVYLGIATFMTAFFTPYPFYTQFLCRDVSWRWVAWLILIWVGVWWIVCAFTYFPDARHNRIQGMTKMQVFQRLDWIGAATSIAGVTLFLVALQDGGYRYPWVSAHVLAPLILGIVTFAGFVVWEGYFAPHPMVPTVLLKEKAVVIPLTVAFGAGVTYFALLGFYALLVQTLYYTKTPVEIAVLTQGFSLGLLLGSAVPNILLSYVKGNVRWVILFCTLMMTAFTGALMHSNPTNPNFSATIASFAAFGIGGTIVPSATVALTCCPDSLIATVAGLGLCVRTLGGAIGTTIYSAIFQNKLRAYLPGDVAEYAVKAGLPVSSAPAFVKIFLTQGGNVSIIPDVTPAVLRQAALGQAWGYSQAFKYVWGTSVAFGGVACVICLFIPNTQKHMTNRVAVDYAKGHTSQVTKDVETKSVGE